MNSPSSPTPPADAEVDVMLLTKTACHLCEEARAVVKQVCNEQQVGWREVVAEDDPQAAELYAEEIPVLFINGVQRDFWRIDPVRLARLITQARAATS